jgi:hypothetical protein
MAINYTYPEKGSPVTTDEFLIIDSADDSTKKVTVANILALGQGGDVGVASLVATSPIVNSGTSTDVSLTLSTVPVSKGGTNLTTLGDAKNVLQVNSAGDGLEYVDVVEGSKHVIQDVRFLDAVEKGDPVYIESYNLGQALTQVGKADASDPTKMPAYGIANAAVSQNTNGTITAIGSFNGTLDTSYLTQNEVIYVDIAANDVPGRPRLTSTKPAGEANLIQNIGFCSRSNANNGEIEVIAVGRANATPNLNSAKIFLGDSSNNSVARAVTGEVTITNTGVTEVTGIDGNVSIQGYSPIITVTSDSKTLTTTDVGKYINFEGQFGGSNSKILTLPSSSEIEDYNVGTEIEVVNNSTPSGVGQPQPTLTVRVDLGANPGTINGLTNIVLTAKYASAKLKLISKTNNLAVWHARIIQ